MKVTTFFGAAALALVCSLASVEARAEQSASLAAAEAAYLQIDFDGTRAACETALKEGNHDTAETLRLYTLLAVAASSLGDEAAAKNAFRYVVALDPDARLDRTLSPKVRAPLLEVRGELLAKGELKPLGAALERHASHLALELADPAGIVNSVDIAYRVGASERVAHWHVEGRAGTTRREFLSDASRVEYTLSAHDADGNTLFRAGSDSTPAVLEPVPSALLRERADAARPSSTPYYVTAGLLAGAGVAAGAVGAVFQLRRESAAREWNGAACEHPGQTRGEQCAHVDDRRRTSQELAIGLYSASGALLIGSFISWLVAPSSRSTEERADLPCAPGVGTFGAACKLAF